MGNLKSKKYKVGEKVILENPTAISNGLGKNCAGFEGIIYRVEYNPDKARKHQSKNPYIYRARFSTKGTKRVYTTKFWCLAEQLKRKTPQSHKTINKNYNI